MVELEQFFLFIIQRKATAFINYEYRENRPEKIIIKEQSSEFDDVWPWVNSNSSYGYGNKVVSSH